jgi:2,7-dihydroxy-5-methyl-1-naphthoate 7-O-methyltransferase
MMSEKEGIDLGGLSDLCTLWCVHVVATLRIAEHKIFSVITALSTQSLPATKVC